MKIVSDCFNFVTTMLNYLIKFKNVLDTHVYKYFIYVYLTGAAPGFWFVGNIHQECTHQRLLKNFEKFIKHLHRNLKTSPKFSNIQFNRI